VTDVTDVTDVPVVFLLALDGSFKLSEGLFQTDAGGG
jgi:hypothetical protein